MKTAIKYLIVFCLFLGFKSVAQQPGDSKPMASNSSVKGRHELNNERKIKKRSMGNAKKQERTAFKKSPLNKKFNLGKKSKKKPRKIKKNKEKRTKNDEPKS